MAAFPWFLLFQGKQPPICSGWGRPVKHKLPRVFAEKLLNFLESGHVKVDQKNCQMDFKLESCKVFATANNINRISKPLQSRFRKFFLSRYTEQQFLDIAEKVLPKLSPSIARYVGAKV